MNVKSHKKFPIIGISANLNAIEAGYLKGYERVAVCYDYIQSIQQVGGTPLILPVVQDAFLIQQQSLLLDGLLLSGGYDVNPLLYGEEPKRELGAICPGQDLYEKEMLLAVLRQGKPIFGICRGLQLLNAVLGGTLYQDIPSAFAESLQHQAKVRPDEATHTVAVLPHTRLESIVKKNVLLTNSFHHQAIKELAPDLVVNARAKDGIIEGVEGIGESFILGVQWHPELMIQKDSDMLKLFAAFVDAARQRRE